MKQALCLLTLLLALSLGRAAAATPAKNEQADSFPGTVSQWHGYIRHDFKFNGRDAIVVVPQASLPGKPWIWRPAFFGAFASVDVAMLALGYHVAYYDVTHLYGSPHAVELGTLFFNEMVSRYGLRDKVIVEGFSRGGMFAVNWAAANPSKVSCLYLDAPVCDVESWPSRKDTKLWNDFLTEWHLTEADMPTFKGNPLDNLRPIAKARIPIIGVAGDSDKTVPYDENLKILASRYRKMHGLIQVILKPGCDHHPHSLSAPAPIVRFIIDKAR